MKAFKSIIEFQKHFGTDEQCRFYLEQQRWGGTPACVHCGSVNVRRFANGSGIFKCREKACRKKFSVTVGTVWQDRKLPLHKMFFAVYLLSVHSKGISSHQLANFLDISQKAAWLLNHKIRAMLTDKDPAALTDMVEADETFVGGKQINKHGNRKRIRAERIARKKAKAKGEKYIGTGPIKGKTMVAGVLQRGGKVITRVIPDTRGETLKEFLSDNIAEGSTIYTDEWKGYRRLGKAYKHDSVQHNLGEYVRGKVHTNTMEGFWSLLKRQIDGIHHSVSPKHLQRYCNEASFRYNNKGEAQDVRFATALANCEGQLQWKQLVK